MSLRNFVKNLELPMPKFVRVVNADAVVFVTVNEVSF